MRKWIIKTLSGSILIYKTLNFFRDLYYASRYSIYRKKYEIDQTFRFNGVDIEMYGDGQIIIGPNSYIGNRSVLATMKDSRISIGKNCSISHNVRIYTGNRNANDVISEKEKVSIRKGDVYIGNDVWIGANVFIMENVKIGKHCVIGANSVVTCSIPDNSIAAGVPARVIKQSVK